MLQVHMFVYVYSQTTAATTVQCPYMDAVWTIIIVPFRNSLTYLITYLVLYSSLTQEWVYYFTIYFWYRQLAGFVLYEGLTNIKFTVVGIIVISVYIYWCGVLLGNFSAGISCVILKISTKNVRMKGPQKDYRRKSTMAGRAYRGRGHGSPRGIPIVTVPSLRAVALTL